jgi:hypothetical protein
MNETTIEKTFKDIVNSFFWLLFLQGLSFIGTGILIYLYPQIITALVITGFTWLGLTSIIAGVRVKKFGNEVEKGVNKHTNKL